MVVKNVDGDVERGFCLLRLVPWEVVIHRVVCEGRGDPKNNRWPFAGLDGWLFDRLKKGCDLRWSAYFFRPRSGGLVGVGLEMGWVLLGLGANVESWEESGWTSRMSLRRMCGMLPRVRPMRW